MSPTLAAQSQRLSHLCTRKFSGVFNGIRTHDLRDGGADMSREERLSSKYEDRLFTAALVRWTLELCPSFTNCISFSFSPHLIIQGNWSRLSTSFSFTRRAGYFLIHIYAPCTLIVILSWISFCIPHDSTAARIALGITSVLTITTILNMLNTTMPKVISYCYLLDSFLII